MDRAVTPALLERDAETAVSPAASSRPSRSSAGPLDEFDGAHPADDAEQEVAAELEVELVTVATQDYATRPVAVARFARRGAGPQPTDRVACMMLAALAIEEVVAIGSRKRAIHLAEQALLGDLLHDDRAANALPSAVLALTFAGRIRRSIDLRDTTLDRHGRRGNVQGFAFASTLRGYAHYCAGDLAASLADTRVTVDLATAHELLRSARSPRPGRGSRWSTWHSTPRPRRRSRRSSPPPSARRAR
jgi:hypothetical protein